MTMTALSSAVRRRILDQAEEVGDPRYDQKVARAFDVLESGYVKDDMIDGRGELWAVRVQSARSEESYISSDRNLVAYVDDTGELVNEGGKGVKCTCPAGRKGVFCYHQLVCTCRRLSRAEEAKHHGGEYPLPDA